MAGGAGGDEFIGDALGLIGRNRKTQSDRSALSAAGATIERIVLAIYRGGADRLREAGYEVDAVAVLRPAG